MTTSAARTAANVVLFGAGAAAAYAIIASPPLRRLAGHGLRWWLGASIPMFVLREVAQAWGESSRVRPPGSGQPPRPGVGEPRAAGLGPAPSTVLRAG